MTTLQAVVKGTIRGIIIGTTIGVVISGIALVYLVC